MRQAAPYDVVIVNARVIDGTGAPARATDIAIKDGRIARIGSLATASTRERLDARGLVVAPGFIDVHTHADDLAGRPHAENFIRMGVTTIVAGNCGSSALAVGEAFGQIGETTAAVNFATLIGHNTVRSAVMGSAEREPTIAELARMKALVFTAMVDGAVGFSTGLQYVPGHVLQKPTRSSSSPAWRRMRVASMRPTCAMKAPRSRRRSASR